MNKARIVTLFQPIAEITAATIDLFGGDPGELLPEARACGLDHWRLPLHAAGVTREVDMHVGEVWQWEDGHWRSIIWTPLSMPGDVVAVEHLLPTFVGEIGLQVDRRTLILTGAYHPPLGAFGAFIDGAAMSIVARSSGQSLLEGIVAQLSQPAHT